jgi:endonuclease/exonuclease/phosphatase family metal-dependent hydrolase
VKIATYNIHGCVGRDGVRDPQRVRAVLNEIDADIVALQEVESLVNGELTLELLSRGSPWIPLAGYTLFRRSVHYGNALLSKLPVVWFERLDLSVRGREPRGAINALLGERGQSIQVIATHLGLRPQERRRQTNRLIAHLNRPSITDEAETTVLLGDLNEWFLWGRPLRWLADHFAHPLHSPATFPAGRPLLALDRIWVQPHHRVRHTQVWRSDLADVASDHLPLYCELG